MKRILLLLLITTGINGYGQDNQQLIKNSINRFFEGMKANDTSIIISSLDSSCFLYSVMTNRNGKTVLQEEKISSFLQQVVQLKGEDLDEQLTSFDIKIDGALAIAWTPYRFYFNKKLSHCGVNVFTLVKRNDAWKIMGITDTRRRNGCEE